MGRVDCASNRKRGPAVTWAGLLVAWTLLSASAAAQMTGGERVVTVTNGSVEGTYERRYGKAQWASLETIARGDAPLHVALRTQGLLSVTRADPLDHSSPE